MGNAHAAIGKVNECPDDKLVNGRQLHDIPGDKVVTFCHSGDLICEGIANITEPHLTYGLDAIAAASAVLEIIGRNNSLLTGSAPTTTLACS